MKYLAMLICIFFLFIWLFICKRWDETHDTYFSAYDTYPVFVLVITLFVIFWKAVFL